jgi:hypothetical protein
MEFSASSLVDRLSPFSDFSTDKKNTLKKALDQIFLRQFDIPSLRVKYLRLVDKLWCSVIAFRELVASNSANADDISAGWTAVQSAGAELKQMFVESHIPQGIVLP